MFDNFLQIFHYHFMTNAMIAGTIIACLAPLIGNFVLLKRIALISDTLAHLALIGVAIGLITHTQPFLVTILVTSIAAILIEKMRSQKKISEDTILALFLPGGLAIALILVSLSGGLNANLFDYLFGSITTISNAEIYQIAILAMIVIGLIAIFYKQLLFSSFDEEGAKVAGLPTKWLNYLLAVLIAVTVSLSMRIVGVLLVGALMVIPSVSAMRIAQSFKASLFWSVIFALIAVFGGLMAAFYFNLPAGSTIVLMSLVIFALVTARQN